jgi:hypothetical protein
VQRGRGGGLQRSGVLAACVAVASSRAAVLGVVMYTVARKGGRGGMQVGRATVRRRRGEGADAFMSGDAEKMRQRAGKAAARGWGRRAWDGGSGARQRGRRRRRRAWQRSERGWAESAWDGGGVDRASQRL